MSELDGEAFSAYGIAKDESGRRVSNIRLMLKPSNRSNGSPLTLRIVRDQTPMTLTLPP